MSDSWYRDPLPNYTDRYGTLTPAQWLNPTEPIDPWGATHNDYGHSAVDQVDMGWLNEWPPELQFMALKVAVNMELMDDYRARMDAYADTLFGRAGNDGRST